MGFIPIIFQFHQTFEKLINNYWVVSPVDLCDSVILKTALLNCQIGFFKTNSKINADQTEYLVTGSGVHQCKINLKSVTVGGHAIKSVTATRNT